MFTTASRLQSLAAALAVAAMLTACGSSSPPAAPSAANGAQAQEQQLQDMVRFARCMRSHGAPNLPDPTSSPHDFKGAFAHPSPAVQSAAMDCRHLLPIGEQQRANARPSPARAAALVAFARCLRTHGFPNFPDPTATGDLSHEMLATAGIDIHQPAVRHAADACVSVTHGVLTTTAVARFIAGQ